MKSLIITGPESTGKTTIASHLSKVMDIRLLEEYSRSYLDKTQGKYVYEDLEQMAIQSCSLINQCTETKMVLDTDILTYKIWSEVKYSKSCKFIQDNLLSSGQKLYLLCFPDIAWVADPLRENPIDRLDLFIKYEQLLNHLELDYFIITGNHKVRLKTALDLATDYFLL